MTRKEEIEQEVGRRNYPLPTMSIGFRQGVRWADKTMLERLRQFIDHHTEIKDVYRFIKYMEEQQ